MSSSQWLIDAPMPFCCPNSVAGFCDVGLADSRERERERERDGKMASSSGSGRVDDQQVLEFMGLGLLSLSQYRFLFRSAVRAQYKLMMMKVVFDRGKT